jgi:hypothetical protein
LKKILNILSQQFFKTNIQKLIIFNNKKKGFIKKKSSRLIKNFQIFIIKNGKIFTNSNEDAAYLKDNYILSEPSYQYRNSKNENIRKNFIFKLGINRFKKKYKGKIVSIISGGAAKNNYAHWIFDSIARLLLIEKILKKVHFDYLYVPSYKHHYQKEIIKYLKIPIKKIISSEKEKYIEGTEIICTTHPFAHRFDKISKPIFNKVRNKFINYSRLSKIKSYNKIYIERDYSNYNFKTNLIKYKDHRILLNNQEVRTYLLKKGFKSLKLNTLSFADQIKIFSKAKIIISMFGAELTNLVFCQKGTKVIELKNNNKLNDYKNISKNCGLNHTQISLKPLFKTKVIQNGLISCGISRLKKAIK